MDSNLNSRWAARGAAQAVGKPARLQRRPVACSRYPAVATGLDADHGLIRPQADPPSARWTRPRSALGLSAVW